MMDNQINGLRDPGIVEKERAFSALLNRMNEQMIADKVTRYEEERKAAQAKAAHEVDMKYNNPTECAYKELLHSMRFDE